MPRPRLAFAMRSDELVTQLFPHPLRARLEEVAELVDDRVLTELTSAGAREVLATTEVLITGWGCPPVDAEVLDAAPDLRLVAHAAGTVKGHLDREVWERGVVVTTAAEANAWPVAEYTLAVVLLAGKRALAAAHRLSAEQASFDKGTLPDAVGNHGATVGIIGASRVGRLVLQLLRPFHLDVLLATPELDADQAAELGARLVPLDELLSSSRVVSLHAPVLPATVGMIGRRELALMPDGSTFVNTARGALVDHDALRDETRSGRISAVLDVTEPEPLPAGDVLYSLPNVALTPHIAGSMGNELAMMGEAAVVEVERFAAGEPPLFDVVLADLETRA